MAAIHPMRNVRGLCLPGTCFSRERVSPGRAAKRTVIISQDEKVTAQNGLCLPMPTPRVLRGNPTNISGSNPGRYQLIKSRPSIVRPARVKKTPWLPPLSIPGFTTEPFSSLYFHSATSVHLLSFSQTSPLNFDVL